MSSSYIDAHCHLADPRLQDILPETLRRAQEKHIHTFVQGGVGPEDWQRQRKLLEKYGECIVPCFGLHPWWVAERDLEENLQAISILEENLNDSVGVGEIGLDFGRRFGEETYPVQETIFVKQLEIAQKVNKPIVLHLVRCHPRAITLLKLHGVPSCGGIVHAFGGSLDIAKAYIDMGLSISLGGICTRPGYKKLKRAITELPLERIVLESDSPDLAPYSWGKRLNEPVSLLEVAQEVSVLRGCRSDELLHCASENVRRIFGLAERVVDS